MIISLLSLLFILLYIIPVEIWGYNIQTKNKKRSGIYRDYIGNMDTQDEAEFISKNIYKRTLYFSF